VSRSGPGWRIDLVVDASLLEAKVVLTSSPAGQACPSEKVVELVYEGGLSLSAEERRRLPRLAAEVAAGTNGTEVVIARGQAPRHQHTKLVWRVQMGHAEAHDEESTNENKKKDLREVTHFVNVRTGDVLCVVDQVGAVIGRDVYGTVTQPRSPEPPITFGLGVKFAADARTVLATFDGALRFERGTLSVEKVLTVSGDVDYKVGNINFLGKVIVQGDIHDEFKVKASADIVVRGMVENAQLESGGNIEIMGGIAGRHTGTVRAKGILKARYLHSINVEADSVVLSAECHDAHITAVRDVIVKAGSIVGGCVRAGRNVTALVIGSEHCVATTIEVGAQSTAKEGFEKLRGELAAARALVESTEAATERLVPGAEPERLAHEAKLEAQRGAVALVEQKIALLSNSSVNVLRKLFPNVQLQLDARFGLKTDSERDGPLELRANLEQRTVDVRHQS
jgi:uncharacterized protein (DUF342 family)